MGKAAIISFPAGCAYRRLLQSWLAKSDVVPEKVLELRSYHAIAACVASGTGIAIVPRSVLETVRVSDSIAIYPLPEEQSYLKTYLVWRQGEISSVSILVLCNGRDLKQALEEIRHALATGSQLVFLAACWS